MLVAMGAAGGHHWWVLDLVRRYGYVALFAILGVQDVGVPTLVPGTVVLLFAGYLVAIGVLNALGAGLAAAAGSLLGASLLFGAARAGGEAFQRRFGPMLGLDARRRGLVERSLERWGMWLWIGCRFVPGVRGGLNVVAGLSGMRYRRFALFSGASALFWVALFLGIGAWLGRNWHAAITATVASGPLLLALAVGALVIYLGMRGRRARARQATDGQATEGETDDERGAAPRATRGARTRRRTVVEKEA
jgi:membrane protein DedA with SNARE-associated domain